MLSRRAAPLLYRSSTGPVCSTVYEKGHTVVLAWSESSWNLSQLIRVLAQVGGAPLLCSLPLRCTPLLLPLVPASQQPLRCWVGVPSAEGSDG